MVKEVSFFSVLIMNLILNISQSLASDLLPHEKCHVKDTACLTTQAQATLQTFVKGIPALGIKPLDIMHVDIVQMHKGDLTYELTDMKVLGFNNTLINSLSIDMALKVLSLSCHTTLLLKFYNKGRGALFSLPVFVEGDAEITLNDLQMDIIFPFDIIKDKQSKDVMDIKTYFYGFDALGGVNFNFTNMYNGDKEKSDMFHSLINTNWRIAVANFGRYFTDKIVGKVYESIKLYMSSNPLEDFFLY